MTSTLNSVSSVNGASGNPLSNPMQQNPSSAASNNHNNSNNNNSGRPAMRSSSTLKTSTDGSRRQAASPVDGAQRRNNPPKAWTQSTNPLTQKPSYPNQNGGAPQRKSTISPNPTASSSPNKESNTPDMHANDRLTFLLAACIGLNATVTTKSGEKFSGIFSGSSFEPNDSSFALKMTQRCSSPQPDHSRSNGLSDHSSPYIGSGVDHQMIFDVQDVADVGVENVSTVGIAAKEQNGAPTGFKTDTDISGGQAVRERELQRWEPGTDAPVDLSLESAGSTSWDQFEVNERLFGATTSYDENLYTTRIDRSDPSYKRKEAEAARIAREIESSETDNAHLREERGLAAENDYANEEDKYSGVRREDFPPLQSGQPNKYTPPARRAPTSHPTVPGAPVDPAIISAQIARPDIPPKQSSQPKINVTSSQTTTTTTTSTTTDALKDKAPEATKSAPSLKPSTGSEQKNASGKPTSNSNVPPKRNGVENASSNVEAEVLDHFRQFANNEKMKLQERRRNQASYDRTIKLNELMKFSKNFKLGTPVPKDLVPILAKDPSKQEEIIEKARRQHEEKLAAAAAKTAGATAPDASTAAAPAAEQKPTATRASGSSRYDVGAVPPVAPSDRQQYPRGRQGYPPMGLHGGPGGRPMGHHTAHPGRSGPSLLSHRLADIQQQRKGGTMGHPMPPPLPIQDGRIPPHGPLSGDQSSLNSPHKSVQSPTSATSTKFNVRAHEFKPNPAAHTFTPGSTSAVASSPASNARPQSISPAASPSAFFGAKKPLPASERPSINDHFNPVKRMKKEATEQSTKDYAFNGGIPQAYRTPPTWEVAPINAEKTYADMFKTPAPVPSASPQRASSNPQLPHQHQLPFHLQHAGPPTTGPPQAHPHPHPQSHHPSGPLHFDDHHRMHLSASTSQVYPSPRLQQTPVAYHSPMGHHAQLAYGQPVPQFYTGQGPQPAHMRHYPGGPQFVNPQNGMGAPMMVQQPSNGPYAGMPQGMGVPYNPQMPMYSPNAGHAYPQQVPPPPQPHSGYPSPSRGAPMMMHQGSQQGHPPQPIMFMNSSQHGQPVYAPQQPGHIPPVRAGYPQHQQSHFNTSPHQTHHYPHQQHRAQNNNHYNQMPHMHHPHMAPQGPPQNAPSGPHPPEAVDEVK